MGFGDWEMDDEKALVQGNRDHWIKIIERATRDIEDRVGMQQKVTLTILGKINSPPPLKLCSMGDCPQKFIMNSTARKTLSLLFFICLIPLFANSVFAASPLTTDDTYTVEKGK